MSTQNTHNCHFVSRFLTTPWEAGERQLWFYCFECDEFDRRSSRKFFAEQNLNSDAVEAWLNKSFETHGRSLIQRLETSEVEIVPRNDPEFRPLWLLFALQGTRTTSVHCLDSRKQLDELAAASDIDVDAFLAPLTTTLDLRIVAAATADIIDRTICVPSAGGFGLVLQDSGCVSGYSFGLGIPLTETSVLLATPREISGRIDVAGLRRAVAAASVGVWNSSCVVVSPKSLEADRARLRARLLADREANSRHATIANEQRELAMLTFRAMGLDVARDALGRMTVPGLYQQPPPATRCEVRIVDAPGTLISPNVSAPNELPT